MTIYKRLGDYIREVNVRNSDLKITNLLGLSIEKKFITSIANTIGADMSVYKIVKPTQFAYVPVTSRNGDKITIALYKGVDNAIISQAYTIFEIINKDKLLPEYLMMWFRRPEFDRYARFHSHGSAREVFEWDELCNVMLPVPDIDRQREIVSEYETLSNRIRLNEQMIVDLEETAQALYRKMFVDSVDKENLPEGWRKGKLGDVAKIKSGFAFKSEWWQDTGVPVIKINNIQNNTIDNKSCDCVAEDKARLAKKCKVNKGTIVIALTGNIGKISVVPDDGYLINQRVGFVDVKDEYYEFIYLVLTSLDIQTQILSIGGGSVQTNISPNDIENIDLDIPPYNVMNNFHDKIKSLFIAIDLYKQEDLKLTELQSLLLARMGK